MVCIPKLTGLPLTYRGLVENARRRDLSLPAIVSRSAGIAGFLLMLASAFTSWFSVPAAASIDAPIIADTPLVSWIYRAASLCMSLATLLMFIRGSRWRPPLLRLYVWWFVALLFFPYFVSVWSPDVAGRASWLQNQHESLISINGDNYRTEEFKGSFLRDRVDVVNDPLGNQVFLLPDWERQNVDWSMLEWFGLSRWFASFLRQGWPFAIFGTAAILFALSREAAPSSLETVQRLLLHGAAVFFVVLLLALVPVLTARTFVRVAKHYTQRGEYASALRLMRFAAWCSPAITQDEDYIMETGLLEDTLGLQKPEADYYRARLAEDAGFRFQSRTMDLEGLHATRNQPAVQRAYVSILLIHAANAFDSGDINDAAALIEQVLATDPVNLRAICSLQLAYLRSGNMDGVNALDQRLTKVYDFFNNLLKEPILATSTENQAVGELDRGDAAAALKAWTESKTR